MTNKSSGSSGIGFCGALQIVFIALKLCGKISWSWYKVLIPTWIELGVLAVVLLVIGIMWLREKLDDLFKV